MKEEYIPKMQILMDFAAVANKNLLKSKGILIYKHLF